MDNTAKDQQRLGDVIAFFATESLQAALMRTVRKQRHFNFDDINIMSKYLFCSLVYRNWQRPGAAISLTIDEDAGDGHLVVHSRQHKTALTHGPAAMPWSLMKMTLATSGITMM